jgi:hypothetical protein
VRVCFSINDSLYEDVNKNGGKINKNRKGSIRLHRIKKRTHAEEAQCIFSKQNNR